MLLRADGVLVQGVPSKTAQVTRRDRFVPWSEVAGVRVEERRGTNGMGPSSERRFFLALSLNDGDLVRTIGVAVQHDWHRNLLEPAYDQVQAARRAAVAGTSRAEPEQSAAERDFRRSADLEGVDPDGDQR